MERRIWQVSHGQKNFCGVLIVFFFGNLSYTVKNTFSDKNGRILVTQVDINGTEFVIVDLYNPNTEQEQINTFEELQSMLTNFDKNSKNFLFGGDFNFFLDKKLEAKGGKPTLKKRSISKLININKSYDLCDIWRLRNPNTKRYTFRQNHFSGKIQRRLDYIFISKPLQEYIQTTDIVNTFLTDHSSITFTFQDDPVFKKGSGI